MSQDYYLACTRCKKSLWVGQYNYLYSDEDTMDRLGAFLHGHGRRPAGGGNTSFVFLDLDEECAFGYESYKDDDPNIGECQK